MFWLEKKQGFLKNPVFRHPKNESMKILTGRGR